MSAWPTEDIPDTARLFRRVHKSRAKDGDVRPDVFSDIEGGMSVDWDKYSDS